MKKNKTLRAAGILFLATMLTTCMTAGTFAKYTTSDSASDSARVAKFGVTISADGSLFGKEYAGNSATNGANEPITYSSNANTGTVKVSASGTNVVAPGTKNDTGIGFSVKGTPEVDVKVEATVTNDNKTKIKDVYLAAGTYAVMEKASNVTAENFADKVTEGLYKESNGSYTKLTDTDTFDSTGATTYYVMKNRVYVADNYYPIVYTYEYYTHTDKNNNDVYETIKSTDLDGDEKAEYPNGLKDFVTEGIAVTFNGMNNYNSKKKEANTNLANVSGSSGTLTWEWKFEDYTYTKVTTSSEDDFNAGKYYTKSNGVYSIADGTYDSTETYYTRAVNNKKDLKDTILGDIIADTSADSADYDVVAIKTENGSETITKITSTNKDSYCSTEIAFNLSISVTQVD